MRLGEVAAVMAVGVPVWLVVRAWRRYFSLEHVALEGATQIIVALWLTSVSTAMWIFGFAVMLLEDHSSGAKSLAANLSPALFGFINLLLCPQ